MKQMLLLAVAVCVLAGCSQNSMTVQNRSSQIYVTLNFRAKSYFLDPGTPNNPSTIKIGDIPNGTYGYGTIYGAAGVNTDIVPGEGLSGNLTFERSATDALLIYGSFSETDSAGVTTVTAWAQASTSDPTGAVLAP